MAAVAPPPGRPGAGSTPTHPGDVPPPFACAPGLPFSLQQLLARHLGQRQIGHPLLELVVCLFQGFAFLHRVHVGATVLLLPAVLDRRADRQARADSLDLLASGQLRGRLVELGDNWFRTGSGSFHVSPTLATGGGAEVQVARNQVRLPKGLPSISNSRFALRRGGGCSGKVNFNCASNSFWSASGCV